MPSPVRSPARFHLCASLVLLPLSAGCANAETIDIAPADSTDGSSIDREMRHDPRTTAPQTLPSAPPAPPAEAAFMTEGSGTIIGYDAFGPEGPLAYRTTFTPRPGSDFGRPPADTVWVARREKFGPEGRRDVKITSSLECPGLVHVLERVSAFDTGRFSVSGISRLPLQFGPQSRDGYTYRFFGPGYGADDSFTRLSVEGSSGEVGALGQAADFQLQACWRPE